MIFFLNLGSFPHTSRAGSIFMRGVSLTHPVLAPFLCGEFLLHIPCCLLFFYLESFSYTSHDCFVVLWEVSLTLPMLASFLCGEFLLHIPYWLYFYLGTFSYTSLLAFFFVAFFFFSFFLWGVFLTHPVLALFLSGDFLLHIPCWLFSHSLLFLLFFVVVVFCF